MQAPHKGESIGSSPVRSTRLTICRKEDAVAVIFEMVKYHHQNYPEDIPLRIEEVAAHFDVSFLSGEL